ncbi:MAG: hydrogenase maturation protease [Terriglobia bacterium]
MLIIGYGSEFRGDDAAGLLVARRLRELGLNAREHIGDGFALIELWKSATEVVLVDALTPQENPGRVWFWDGRQAPLESEWLHSSSHLVGIAEAIEMARLLDALPEKLWIYGIEGKQFQPGSAPSLEVLQSIEEVVQMISSRHSSGEPFGRDA